MAESSIGALQVGRRAMVVSGALVVPPTSDVYVPQELAGKVVGLDYGNGTAYAGYLMLDGAVPRDAVKTCAAPYDLGARFAALMRGEFAATVFQEPYITVAEKAGCRLLSTTFFHGTWVASPDISIDAYAAMLRGCRRAVKLINADKRRYMSYFLRDHPNAPEVQALEPEDFNLGRIQLKDPGPIPESEARWAWDWMASWGLLEGTFDLATQIDRRIERAAHERASAALAGDARR